MFDCCVMCVARNSEDYLDLCIRTVAPYVSSVKLTVDSRSTDDTWQIAVKLMKDFKNVQATVFKIENPKKDLVAMRNSQLSFDEEWGFIVDSDEFHFDIENYHLGGQDAYAFQCYAVWNEIRAHRSSSKARIGRIFRNYGKLEWKGKWGKETLYRNNLPVFRNPLLLPHKYIHFTHVKKDKWRKEMHQERIADDKYLFTMPDHIIRLVRETYAKAV